MSKKFHKENYILNIEIKLILIFILFTILILIAAVKINSISNDIGLNDKKIYTKERKSIYPNIYSRSGILLASSFNYYKIYLDKRKIDLDYLKLYLNHIEHTINKKINQVKIINKFKQHKRVLVADDLTIHEIRKILTLNKRYIKNGFFKKIYSKSGKYYFYGIEYVMNEKNTRKYNDKALTLLQPMFGKYNFQNIAISGIEKYFYDKTFEYNVNLLKRDAYNNILYTQHNNIKQEPNIHLSLDIKLTQDIQDKIIIANAQYNSDNIIVAVAKTNTGELLSINQFKKTLTNDKNVTQTYFNMDFLQFFYEPGSVLKPITLAIALENNKVKDLEEIIDVNFGKMRIGHKTITDDEKDKEKLSILEIITHSSNVGISKIALRFENGEFITGLDNLKFFDKPLIEYGVSKKNVFNSSVKKAIQNNKLIQRVTTAFGYGFLATPYSVMEMYNTIANDGLYVPLSLLKKNKVEGERLLKKDTIEKLDIVLHSVVTDGTGLGANMDSFKIYGKTGTAHISEGGKYINKHNSTFIGYVEDKNNKKYTIYVLVSKPDWKHHFASLSAVPIFKKVVKLLVKNNYLSPSI